jgi:hypothetical protein
MEEKGETTEHYLLEKCGESNSTERSQRPQELVVHKISQFDDVAFPCSPRLNPPLPLLCFFHFTTLCFLCFFFLKFDFFFCSDSDFTLSLKQKLSNSTDKQYCFLKENTESQREILNKKI